MQLTRGCEYAIRALTYLAMREAVLDPESLKLTESLHSLGRRYPFC